MARTPNSHALTAAQAREVLYSQGELNISSTRLFVALILLGGLVERLVFVFGADQYNLLGTLADDAYYYLKISLNLWTFGNFTFDGLHLTNGFHPLWQILLAGPALLVRERFSLIVISI